MVYNRETSVLFETYLLDFRKMGARNSKQRTTPFIVPWRDLTQEWKDVDRVMVECVPRVLKTAGYRIYKMKEAE